VQTKALAENRRLFLDAEANLREIERLNQRLSGAAWADYLRARRAPAMGFTFDSEQLRSDTQWTPTLAQAATKGRPVVKNDGKKQIVAVPVELRGETIGALEVEVADNARQSDTIDMIQSVAQRLALSIDNARLFEQAQEIAQQELEVNAISAKIQGNTDMEDILRIVLSELSRALGAQQASIRVGVGAIHAAEAVHDPMEAGNRPWQAGATDTNGNRPANGSDWVNYSQGRRTSP
jgi:GAF domain-containing protein